MRRFHAGAGVLTNFAQPSGRDPRALPHAVLQVEQPDARPVARGAVVVAGQQEVAVRIGFEHLAADADPIEERALRPGQVFLRRASARPA